MPDSFYAAAASIGETFSEMVNQQGKLSDVTYQLGEILFGIMLAISPNDARLYFELGNYREMAVRDYSEIAAAYLKATECQPDFAKAHRELCAAAYAAGDIKLAGEAFDKALSLDKSVFESDDWAVDYIEEFLRNESRIEDWIYVAATRAMASDKLLKNFQAAVLKLDRMSLRKVEPQDDLRKLLEARTNPFADSSTEYARLIEFGDWLRGQPLEIRRKFAAEVWNGRRHKLPGD